MEDADLYVLLEPGQAGLGPLGLAEGLLDLVGGLGHHGDDGAVALAHAFQLRRKKINLTHNKNVKLGSKRYAPINENKLVHLL